MTLAFLSGFKYLGPGTGNDQGGSQPGSWVCVSGWHALLICRARSFIFPSFPTSVSLLPSRSDVVKCVFGDV